MIWIRKNNNQETKRGGMAMRQVLGWKRITQLAGLTAVLGSASGWLLVSGGAKTHDVSAASPAAQRRPSGQAQLISSVPLPEASSDGPMCEWEPASAPMTFAAMLAAQETQAKAMQAADAGATTDFSKRKPVRSIHDPYSAYSSVAVDPANNEVVMTVENLFSILAYDRMANTPPKATMTEPKRSIGGLNTKIEFQCGLYIDPTNGDIFAVHNDKGDRVVIFSRQARGNGRPDR